MSKKPSWHKENKRLLIELLESEGYEYHWLNEYQVRIMGASHVIDIWTPRMVHHLIAGEVIKSEEPYYRVLDSQFNKSQVIELLESGHAK